MSKLFILASILFGVLGFKSGAEAMEHKGNKILMDLMKSGLTWDEIKKLDELSIEDMNQYESAIQQDMRIKGELKAEMLATGNAGGRPCGRPGRGE